jgi:beta-N-acetylhexosaminidase
MAAHSSPALRKHVGQLMIMGFDGTAMNAQLRGALTALHPGGVILFKRNIEDARQTHALLRDAQKLLAKPLFRCVDMEGGSVDRFRDVTARIPAAADVAATHSEALYRRHGALIGKQLRALGFNVDFAPCLDLGLEASRHALGSRTVSANPKQVVVYAREFLVGLHNQRLLGCGKLDSHQALPVIQRAWQQVWDEDLMPYRRLRRELEFVMVAHVEYPRVVRKPGPASLSPRWIQGVLRDKVGYRGLIISDDLDMGGVLNGASIEDAAVGTLEAGCDMFLVCQKTEHVWRAYDAVLKQAEKSIAFAGMVSRKARRVAAFQRQRAELAAKLPPPPTADCVSLFRRHISEFTSAVNQATISAVQEPIP